MLNFFAFLEKDAKINYLWGGGHSKMKATALTYHVAVYLDDQLTFQQTPLSGRQFCALAPTTNLSYVIITCYTPNYHVLGTFELFQLTKRALSFWLQSVAPQQICFGL